MAISQALCTSAKVDFFSGAQTPLTDTIKIALYTSAATLSADTTEYSATNEVPASGSYPDGGGTLLGTVITSSGTTAWITFSNITFTAATITARGALIYNASRANKSIAVLDFGSDKSSVSGDFPIQFPTADASSAIIRFA